MLERNADATVAVCRPNPGVAEVRSANRSDLWQRPESFGIVSGDHERSRCAHWQNTRFFYTGHLEYDPSIA